MKDLRSLKQSSAKRKNLAEHLKFFLRYTAPALSDRLVTKLGFEPIRVYSIYSEKFIGGGHGKAIVCDSFSFDQNSDLFAGNLEWARQQNSQELLFKVNRPSMLRRASNSTIKSLARQFKKRGYTVKEFHLPLDDNLIVYHVG